MICEPNNTVKRINYLENGSIKSEYCVDKNGQHSDGFYKYYYKSGTIKIEGVRKGKNIISVRSYYPFGQLKSISAFKDGATRLVQFWDSSGNLTLDNGSGYTIEQRYESIDYPIVYCEYERGLRNGLRKEINKDGLVFSEELYKDNNRVKVNI